MNTPLIGITGRQFPVRTATSERPADGAVTDYCDGVVSAGGLPVVIPQQDPSRASLVVERLDGLIFTGGGDVDPGLYGESSADGLGVDRERDDWELALILAAERAGLPVLTICRGTQVLNVAMGGTLWIDIPTQLPEAEPHGIVDERAFTGHQNVRIEETSRLCDVIGSRTGVNSIHHQAVREVADGFKAVAWADDGVIEAIEPIASTWPVLAVQWHPEYLEAGRPLFEWIVSTATPTGD